MQQQVLAVVALERVDHLLVLARAERGDHHRLGLAAREQRAAMHPRQHADLGRYQADAGGVAPVDAPPGIQDGIAHDRLLELLEHAQDRRRELAILAAERLERRPIRTASTRSVRACLPDSAYASRNSVSKRAASVS